MRLYILGPRSWAAYSYHRHKNLEMLFRNGDAIILQSGNVPFDRFFDIDKGFLPGLSLADAAGKTLNLCYPVAIFSGSKNHLSHSLLDACME